MSLGSTFKILPPLAGLPIVQQPGLTPTLPFLQFCQAIFTALMGGGTQRGTTGTILTATPTTAFSLGTDSGLWLVEAIIPDLTAANAAAVALILNTNQTGTGTARIALNSNGVHLTITLSTLDVVITQTTGSAQIVNWAALRLADI